MGKGRRYEHTVVNNLSDITTKSVWVSTVGWSGNDATTSSDVVVTIDPQLALSGDPVQYNIELKKRSAKSGRRNSSVFGGSEKGETGVEEVRRLVEGTPSWATPIIALKFDRRKLIVLDARWLLTTLGEMDYHVPTDWKEILLDVLKPRVTDGGSISMVKPDSNVWPSATAADADEIVLASALDLPYMVEA